MPFAPREAEYPLETALSFLRAIATADDLSLSQWFDSHDLDAAAVRWLYAQGLAAYAFHRLRRAELVGRLSAENHATLRQMYIRAAADSTLHSRELAEALAALAAAGITSVLFKGAVLAHTVYPSPICRPMGDLDFWLRAEDMPRAQVVLEELGYVQRVKAHRPVAMQARRQGEIQLVGQGRVGRGLIELHWGVFAGEWLYRVAAIENDAIVSRLRPVEILGHPVFTLAPEDTIIQLAVHLAINHQMARLGVRGLLDVVQVARHHPIDWQTVADRARRWRVATATWLVLALAAETLALDEARPLLAQLRPAAGLQRTLLARFVDVHSVIEMRNLTRGPRRFVYLLLMTDRRQDALRVFYRALWPEAAWLATRYGQVGPGIRVRHLAGALRGRP